LGNTAPIVARHSAVMVYDLATRVGREWFRRELRLYGAMSLAAARRAEVVLTDSTQVAGELEDAGVEARRISVVRLAVDDRVRRAADAQIEDVRARFDLTRPYVLHVGWADPRKDAATLAAAHLRIVADRPHDLVLAGLAHPNFVPVSVPHAASIRRVGYVSDDDLTSLLSGAAVLAYPSRYEGFGIPPLEAMACGTPTVVSDIPALRESTENRVTYVRPGDIGAWADALCAALDGQIEAQAPPTWTWSDAGDQLVTALAPLLA
jgi:glycosyltransferase involved in cell wall biosynthesis